MSWKSAEAQVKADRISSQVVSSIYDDTASCGDLTGNVEKGEGTTTKLDVDVEGSIRVPEQCSSSSEEIEVSAVAPWEGRRQCLRKFGTSASWSVQTRRRHA